ncbi:MAG: twin-arginine translocation signal domain-containing protein [Chitinophagaceae bacterium]|nr:twin-arginine translocation signal domain-containing protein [Chitinophagaceae bacterium]
MKQNIELPEKSRRQFLTRLATGAAAAGLAAIPTLDLKAENEIKDSFTATGDPDAWFNQVKGKHRIVYDTTGPHEIFPFAWARVFLATNEATGTPASDCGVVVILRHLAICFALDHSIWEKYNLGTVFKVDDAKTNAASKRNPFWKPAAGDYKLPGIGEVKIGINELQADGVMFCVCGAAMSVFSAKLASQMNMKADDVLNEWKAALLPGIQVVPSGVWAVGRAQEHDCKYCFVG